jgi:hypothetical protein
MNETLPLPTSVTVSSDGVCALYSEVWRLEQLAEVLVDRIQAASARRIARQIRAGLAEIDVEIIDYAGRPYDPGMVPEVLDVQLVDGAAGVGDVVSETIEPTLVWRGQVLRRGQIVVRRVVFPGGDEGERQ